MDAVAGSEFNPEGLARDIRRERLAFVETLERVGPEAPTLCSHWQSGDLAAHVASLDRMRGVPTFLGRSLVARFGLRLNRPAVRFPKLADLAIGGARRRGFDWALDRLRHPPPRLLMRPSTTAVGLFEVRVHHQDVLRANDGTPHVTDPDLSPVLPWLLRYHGRPLRDVTLRLISDDGRERVSGHGPEVVIRGEVGEIVLWLSGRCSAANVVVRGELASSLEDRIRV